LKEVRKSLAKQALKPLYNPVYREKLLEIKKENEQIIDTISPDTLIFR